MAESIKKEFDKRHGPTWHCIVGRNFGNFKTLFLFFPLLGLLYFYFWASLGFSFRIFRVGMNQI